MTPNEMKTNWLAALRDEYGNPPELMSPERAREILAQPVEERMANCLRWAANQNSGRVYLAPMTPEEMQAEAERMFDWGRLVAKAVLDPSGPDAYALRLRFEADAKERAQARPRQPREKPSATPKTPNWTGRTTAWSMASTPTWR